MCWCFWELFSRRKPPGVVGEPEDAKLGKVYYTRDLVAYGVGSTLGAGVYVLSGTISRKKAGPAAIISFLIAASGSAISGLCYAEFGGRVPRSGSAYNFSYICIGELIAFIIGWDLIMEYSIGVAALARSFGSYIDTAVNFTMSDAFKKVYEVESRYFESYFDFFAFSIIVALGIGLAFGLKQIKWLTITMVVLNLLVITFSIIAGACFINFKNWSLPPPVNTTDGGSGGFFPFGFEGVVEGAAEAFFGFVGFDGIACAGEEVNNPAKSIPRGIILTLVIGFVVYCGMSTVTTLALPYYEQDTKAAMVHIFDVHNFHVGKWIVFIGGLCALITSVFGCLYPLPRMIYAMSKDNMLFKWLGIVSERFKTPVIGTLVSTLFTATLAATIKTDELVDMMSIGTLMAYTLVAMGIMILRYEVENRETAPELGEITFKDVFQRMFKRIDPEPTRLTSLIANMATGIFVFLTLIMVTILRLTMSQMFKGRLLYWLAPSLFILLILILILIVINFQPKSVVVVSYKVPLVPFLPGFAVVMNLYLMTAMDLMTWMRFIIWCVVGMIIYVSYSYWKSKQRKNRKGEFVNVET